MVSDSAHDVPTRLGRSILARNRETFVKLLANLSRDSAGELFEASVCADWAARHHSGFFRSPELERLCDRHPTPRGRSAPRSQTQLVVLTQAYDTGGHTRLAVRWIQSSGHQTNVVLTAQAASAVPATLRSATRESGGDVLRLDRLDAPLHWRALALAQLATEHKQIVLLGHPWDSVIQAASSSFIQPTIWLNHSDYNFSLVPKMFAVSVDIRRANQSLSQMRRGIPAERSLVLPVPLDVPAIALTRAQARRALGIPDGSKLVVTVAAPHRYSPLGEIDYLRLAEQVLSRNEAVVIHAVGAVENDSWRRLAKKYPNRLHAKGTQPRLAPWHAAADVFLECVPWGSYTAALEFAILGVPLVTFRPVDPLADLDPDAATTYGVLLPGQESWLPRMADEVLASLENASQATKEADRLADRLLRHHAGDGWKRQVQALEDGAARMGSGPVAVEQLGAESAWDSALAFVQESTVGMETVGALRAGHVRYAGLDRRLRALLGGEASPSVAIPNGVLRRLLSIREVLGH